MDDFASDTDSDYTSYWRDWVSVFFSCCFSRVFGEFRNLVGVLAGVGWSVRLGVYGNALL